MKIEDLQKIVDARKDENYLLADGSLIDPTDTYVYALDDHIDLIMEVLRAASSLMKVEFDPIDSEEIEVLKKLKRALKKLEAK